MSLRASIVRWCAVAVAALVHLGCTSAPTEVAGKGPPYLAVVVFVDAAADVPITRPFSFRVRETSGLIGVDTTFRASTKDTTILSVPAASYRVDISDVPPTCEVRSGNAQGIVVPPNTNTSLVRFFISCDPGLTVITGTDGAFADADYVVSVTGAGKPPLAKVITANDTVRFADIAAGTYEVSLRLIATNCVVTSQGGETVRLVISARGSALIRYRVVCAEAAKRPRIVRLTGSYANGSIAYVIRATDPDGDITRSFVDVTDCNRRSILPNGGQLRGGYSSAVNVARRDTAVIVGAYDLTLQDAQLANQCLAVWVDDERGNVSSIVEVPLPRSTAARAPVAADFRAVLQGTTFIRASATPVDPNLDYVGGFLVYLARDGILAAPDGQFDRLVADPAGIIGPVNTQFVLRPELGFWSDYVGVVLYLVDAEGNFNRLLDLDLFR
jgi:hypothetical protein